MSYPDPFDERSPWDETPETTTPTKEESPVTSTAPDGPAPFTIGFTLKAGTGFDAEWLTPKVYGHTADETAERGAELLTAMKSKGLIDLMSKAADYTRSQYKGGGNPGGGSAPKRFSGGRVENTEAAPTSVAGDDCPHGRALVKKPTWTAMFCQAENKADQCEPLWQDKKSGQFKANK